MIYVITFSFRLKEESNNWDALITDTETKIAEYEQYVSDLVEPYQNDIGVLCNW